MKKIEKDNKVICRLCRSDDVSKLITYEGTQLYHCKKCGLLSETSLAYIPSKVQG